MIWKKLKTEEDYNIATMRLMEIFHAKRDSAEFEELELLIILVKEFDDKNYHLLEN